MKEFYVLQCRFLIGREKSGVESEVARLISETLQHETSPENQEPKDEDHHEPQNHLLQDEKQISQIHDQYHDQQEIEPLAEKRVVQQVFEYIKISSMSWIHESVIIVGPMLWLIQDKQKETEKNQGAEDALDDLAQKVFSQLRSQGVDLPEDIDPTELKQKFKEVYSYI